MQSPYGSQNVFVLGESSMCFVEHRWGGNGGQVGGRVIAMVVQWRGYSYRRAPIVVVMTCKVGSKYCTTIDDERPTCVPQNIYVPRSAHPVRTELD